MRPLAAAVVVFLTALAGCANPEIPPPAADDFVPRTAVYRCAGAQAPFVMVTRTDPAGLHVFLPPSLGEPYRRLDALAARQSYAAAGIRVDIGDRSATLTVADAVFPDCAYDHHASVWEHAKLNGVDFRAVGNEPGWVLEVREQVRLELSYDYGAGELSLPIVATDTDPEARTTVFVGRHERRELRVTLTGETCRDTMSDEVFPTRVVVAFADRVLTGCGRPLH